MEADPFRRRHRSWFLQRSVPLLILGVGCLRRRLYQGMECNICLYHGLVDKLPVPSFSNHLAAVTDCRARTLNSEGVIPRHVVPV